jgi:hypothetical protein
MTTNHMSPCYLGLPRVWPSRINDSPIDRYENYGCTSAQYIIQQSAAAYARGSHNHIHVFALARPSSKCHYLHNFNDAYLHLLEQKTLEGLLNPEHVALCQISNIYVATNLVHHLFDGKHKTELGKNEGPTVHISTHKRTPLAKGNKEKEKSPHQG